VPRGLLLLVVPVAVLAAAIPAAATGSSRSPRPRGRDHALRDGCQRSFVNETLVNSPEWVYVNHDAATRVAKGTSRVTHVAATDQPGTHRTFDFNSNLVPDRRYAYLVAGSKTRRTNNFAGGGGEGESVGRLHYEWELGALPRFAWPADGDRTELWGSWIWDCGHWTTSDRISGERTELHPLSAIEVHRRNPYAARGGESESDFYLSSSGTYAHAVEECARRMRPLPDSTYGAGFFGCARSPAHQLQRLSRRYSFFVPAPRRPAGARRLLYRAVTRVHRGRTRERIRVLRKGLAVTVWPRSRRLRYGRSFFVRWSARAKRPTRLKVTLRSLIIKRADPDLDYTDDPNGAHDVLYLEVNGRWRRLNAWLPGLAAARDGQRFEANRSLRINVQPGHGVEVMTMGFECDQPSGRVLFGHFVPVTPPCPATPEETHIRPAPNDDLGIVLDRYPSARAALGRHTRRSAARARFPHTGRLSFGDGRQGQDAYEITYTVR
jgi:hypothetical protein